jgi:hypothetical protein
MVWHEIRIYRWFLDLPRCLTSRFEPTVALSRFSIESRGSIGKPYPGIGMAQS